MGIAIIENPNEIECTLKFTMRLKEWKQIRKTLGNNAAYAEMQIIREIQDLIMQIEKTFHSDVG